MRILSFRGLWLSACVVLVFSGVTDAQTITIDEYKARVVTKDGRRIRGTLDDVSETYVAIGDNDQAAPWFKRSGGKVFLSDIRKVVIRRLNRPRAATIQGAVAGGLIAGFLIVQSTKKNGFNSPALYGVNLVLGAAAGAAAGALIGHKIRLSSSKTVRPLKYGDANESLRRQLDPFTYSYQNDLLNRIKQ